MADTQTDKMVVKFTRDYLVQDENVGTSEETRFRKGQRVSLPRASARHFIDRGAAVLARKTSKG